MEQEDQEIQEELGMGGKIKNWLQDNIRIIISVLIVVAIAGGIYSYSNRGENPSNEEEIAMEEAEKDNQTDSEEISDTEENKEDVVENKNDEEENVEVAEPAKDEVAKEEVKEEKKEEVKEAVSEETGESFVVKAGKGDSVTTLSRKALKDYLEKNNDSSLTAEHKIYIEDYLRKNVKHDGSLAVDEEISFSKQLIQNAIEKSKTLNEKQLENLKKYSSRVSNL